MNNNDNKPSENNKTPENAKINPKERISTDGRERKPYGGNKKPYDRNKKPYDGKKKPYDRNKKPYDGKKKSYPREAMELAQEHGIPPATAFLITKGKKVLEEVLAQKAEKDQRKEKAREIMAKYPNINLALACLLVKEGITPEQHLEKQKGKEEKKLQRELAQKKKMEDDKSQDGSFKFFSKLIENKIELTLAKYGGFFQTGLLLEFTPYEFSFQSPSKPIMKIHRLQLKYMYEKESEASVKRMIMVDKSIQPKKLKPTHGREGRFAFPEGVLEEGNELLIALHEGEIVRGTVEWFTPYDIYINVGKGKTLIFKHSVIDCKVMRRKKKENQ